MKSTLRHTGVLTLIAIALLALGPFEARVPGNAIARQSLGFSFLPAVDREKPESSILPSTPSAFDERTPPPGLNKKFISQLAAECPAVTEAELTDILNLTWKICKEESYHFVRLVAQMRAESDFNPDLISKAGARGLLQILPRTGEFMGFKDVLNPEDNIRCAIRYMKFLNRFVTETSNPREEWIAKLASYNSGPGHYVEMVRRAKLRYGKKDWSHVSRTYRRRFRKAKGHNLPETLIYVNRNLNSLKRLQDNLFTPISFSEKKLNELVRSCTYQPAESSMTD